MEMEFSITRYRNGEELFTEAEKDAKIKEGMNEDDFDEEEIVLSVEFDGEWVDEGLGETEFWGIVENDVDWQYEVDTSDPDNWETMRVQKLNQLYENSMTAPIPDEVFDFAIYSLSDYEERSEFATDIRDYVFNRRSEFCTGVLDPNSDADWDEYIKGLKALNYDRWIELAQIGYDRLFD